MAMNPNPKWRGIHLPGNRLRAEEALLGVFQDLEDRARGVLLAAFEDCPACVAPALYRVGTTLPSDIRGHATSKLEGYPGKNLSEALLSDPGLATDIAMFATRRVEEKRQEGRRREIEKRN